MKKRRTQSIFHKMFMPILLLILLEMAIFVTVILSGGVLTSLRTYADSTLAERVSMRAGDIGSQFTMRWTKLDNGADELAKVLVDVDATGKELIQSDEKQKAYLAEAETIVKRVLRQNSVNGVFIILNSNETETVPDGDNQLKNGLCIRDYDQTSSYNDVEDLLIDRSPASLTAQIGCPLDSWWETKYTFKQGEENNYYYMPLQAAYDYPDADALDLAYFCGPHRVSQTDTEMVSYSMPLIDRNGTVYGVFGVEISTSYLASLLPSEELDGVNNGAYILAGNVVGTDEYVIIAQDGAFAQRCFGSDTTIVKNKEIDADNGVMTFEARSTAAAVPCGAETQIAIYNHNTPFESNRLVLLGVVSNKSLNAISSRVTSMLVIAGALSLVLAFFGIVIVCRMLSQPISELSDKVARGKNNSKLEHIGITEIDRLTDSIEMLNSRERESFAKTEFFARMSHDMRTPMNAIIGFSSDELVNDATEKQKTEYLGKIHESADYLLGLINEVLDMSKVERDALKLNLEPVAMNEFWKSTTTIIKEVALQKNIKFVTELGDTNLTLMADSQRLQQVFVNILSNAVKFTPDGGTVSLTIKQLSKTDEAVENQYIISDTGRGMSKEFMDKMYTPFERENPGKIEGTGLGLSICRRIVDIMGGTIVCESELGKGSTFTITLKNSIVSEGGAENMPVQEEQKVDISVLKGKHILLCEDHPLNTQIAVKLLERVGCTVDCAENGQVGVDKFDASAPDSYDAVLMDIRMPVLNGLEAARGIRSLARDDAKRVPIIAMTANAFDEDVRRSRASGMNAHLAKPINPDKLYETLAILTENLPEPVELAE